MLHPEDFAHADDSAAYPIVILDADGAVIDRAGNEETAESLLYGDLSTHDGRPRVVRVPGWMTHETAYLRRSAEINADCYGIALDVIAPIETLDTVFDDGAIHYRDVLIDRVPHNGYWNCIDPRVKVRLSDDLDGMLDAIDEALR